MFSWFCNCWRHDACARIILVVGPVREVGGAVKPTPQYKKWPLLRGELIMAFQMTSSQESNFVIGEIKDKRGNPAQIDGVPEWFTDNTDVLSLTPSEDGRSCLVKAVGPLGVARVSLTADADLGEGVKPLSGILDIEITAGEATTITINPGTPTEQPE